MPSAHASLGRSCIPRPLAPGLAEALSEAGSGLDAGALLRLPQP